jgi:hypothetical protein
VNSSDERGWSFESVKKFGQDSVKCKLEVVFSKLEVVFSKLEVNLASLKKVLASFKWF